MRPIYLSFLLFSSSAMAQQADMAKLCTELADPSYTIVAADGKHFNLPGGLDDKQREHLTIYLATKVAFLRNLRKTQVGLEAEAQLNLLEMGLKGDKLPAALEKVRQQIRDDTNSAQEEAKGYATYLNQLYNDFCSSQAAPSTITAQPIPGRLLPGLALTGVVAAPLPPSAPASSGSAAADLVWNRNSDAYTVVESTGTLSGSRESWHFTGPATVNGKPTGADVTCDGHLTAAHPEPGAAGTMACDIAWGTPQTAWHCEGPGALNVVWSVGDFWFAEWFKSCVGTETHGGKSERNEFGLIGLKSGLGMK